MTWARSWTWRSTDVTTREAVDHLRDEFRKSPDFAWAWHCNIAMAFVDEGGDRDTANRAASRFMQQAFGVKTREPWGSAT